MIWRLRHEPISQDPYPGTPRLLVRDRDEVIAEIVKPGASLPTMDGTSALLQEWLEQGVLRPPTRSRQNPPDSGLKMPEGTASTLLDAEREK